MLGGLDPVVIFQFYKNIDTNFVGPVQPSLMSRIPIISQDPLRVPYPPIPIYLSETLFNIAIDSESKSVDIGTFTDTTATGGEPDVTQKGIQSSVEINIEGKSDSVALILLSALIDQAFEKSSSKEYGITYLHGATTIFNAVLQSYSVDTVPGTDKLSIKIGLTRGGKNPVKKAAGVVVEAVTGTVPL